MTPYHTKKYPLPGTSWNEVAPRARTLLRTIAHRTRRRPYIRSVYFNKQKIFFTYFWKHLSQKPFPEQLRRLKYLPCGLELIERSRLAPLSRDDTERPNELWHRFAGITPNNHIFYVQIKEFKRTGKKELMSIFPLQKIPR